ncbi:MAG: DUF3307 domain-containing protein [Bacteroidota bacterium]
MVQLLFLQIIAHVLSDYFFQTDASSKEKNKNGFKSKFLLKHAIITFVCSYALSLDVNFVFCALGISILHYLIDGLKKDFNTSRFSFFIDQILHLIVIWIFVWIFNRYFESNVVWMLSVSIKGLAIILGYMICIKPTNIFIRETLVVAKIESISNTTAELKNAGKLIGILERILVLTFVIIGKLEVVGFLIAAKSILRYKDTNTIKTEYVLIGTMLSFGIAMMIGLLIGKL